MISILDINPAAKGHLLVMTKEHYPILPLIPFETAAHMFRITKELSKALKSAIVTGNVTVFIANGAIAGQQSPHFLYHLVPRENNDGLDNFNVLQKDCPDEEIKQYVVSFKGKIGLMMKDYHAKKGKPAEQSINPEIKPLTHKDLARFIEENPNVKEIILNNPEGFKVELEKNPELKQLFAGININRLSEALSNLKK